MHDYQFKNNLTVQLVYNNNYKWNSLNTQGVSHKKINFLLYS